MHWSILFTHSSTLISVIKAFLKMGKKKKKKSLKNYKRGSYSERRIDLTFLEAFHSLAPTLLFPILIDLKHLLGLGDLKSCIIKKIMPQNSRH